MGWDFDDIDGYNKSAMILSLVKKAGYDAKMTKLSRAYEKVISGRGNGTNQLLARIDKQLDRLHHRRDKELIELLYGYRSMVRGG